MAEQEGGEEARRVAVEVLSDLVREVDLLPARNEAVKVVLAGTFSHLERVSKHGE